MYFRDRKSWIDYLYNFGPYLRFLANGARSKVTALHRLHRARHGAIRMESGFHGTSISAICLPAISGASGQRHQQRGRLHR